MLKLRTSLLVLATFTLAACSDSDSDSSADTTAAVTATSDEATTTAAATTTPDTMPDTTAAATEGHIRGTAYTFNTPDPIAGATVSLVEFPEITAVTAADGSYELAVPAGATVTPVIEAEGHHSVHLQTFTLDAEHEGVEIDGANFQTPETLLAPVAFHRSSARIFAEGCVIVTTGATRRWWA
jgi:hypothetical protein